MTARGRLGAILLCAAVSCAATSAMQTRPDSAAPPLPFIDRGACPFEGCVYRDWIAREKTDAYDRGFDTFAAKRRVVFSVAPRERVTAMSGTVITTRPGRIAMDVAATMHGEPIFSTGRPATPIALRPGEVVYLLTYRGEGFYVGWVRGQLMVVDLGELAHTTGDADRTTPGRVVNQPTSEWWVRIRNAKGQFGWTNQPDRFDNKDALGAP